MSTTYYKLDPQIYDDQFWWKKDDIEFWKHILSPKTSIILELAAGTGRLALPLLKEGFDYTGLEISNSYCKHANKKLKNFFNKKIIFQGDMRFFNLEKQYDKIIIPFNSLLHLLEEKDLISTLQCIKKHMHAKSELYIDIFVPHPIFLNSINSKPKKRMEFYNSITLQETIIRETIDYDVVDEIVNVKWWYESEGNIYDTFCFDMRMYYPDTMNRVLIEQGFNIIALWGNYDLSTFNEQSDLQIYKCQLQ